MDKVFVIFNPAARGEKSRRLRRFLEAKASADVVMAPTRCAGDAKLLAARAVADGYSMVIAAGGDGTINEVINGLGPAGPALGVLPLGTVNVFAQELGIPNRIDAAWSVIEQGRRRTIDLACASANGVTRHFVQLAGVGFDAQAVRTASWELKKKIGPLSYVWAGLKTISSKPIPVQISTNASSPRAGGAAVLVGNGRFYGGPFALFPQARLDDGQLDVCVFEKCRYWDVLLYGQGILRRVHTKLRGVQYFQIDRLTCSAAGTAAYQLDGEDAGDVPVTFSLLPRALQVVVP
ncbi:MAG TPA: diacylglycerol kinase family protein [Verrucomicrobiae bacterium]|nr:diacylglycerol kinase family protein [Verrucomicrobiae bacterium]